MKADEVEEEPQDGPQQGAEGPTKVLLQEWPHHKDMGYADEPSKQGSARRAEATIGDEEEEVQDRDVCLVKHRDEEKTFTPEEISSVVLTKLKETAEAYLGHDLKGAVVTVSAYVDNRKMDYFFNE